MSKQTRTVDAVVEPFAPTATNRKRASQLRAMARAGAMLSPEDAAWLGDYDEARGVKADERSMGASRGRKVSYVEEEHEAMGEGSSAVAEMAAAGSMCREEGRRYDSLLTVGIAALRQAVDTYGKMTTMVLERNKNLEEAHIEMMRACAGEYRNRVEAETDLIRVQRENGLHEQEEKKDGIAEMAEQLLPLIMAQMGKPS